MARDVDNLSSSPPKYEALLADTIEQARHKIRLHDLGRGLLALACLLFGYALVVAIFDLCLGGSDSWIAVSLRIVAFVSLLGCVGLLGTFTIKRFLTNVNPYFAARQLEDTIPESKNSIINWLDLKDEKLPPVIHQAVGLKASRDMKEADPDLVASPGDLWKLGTAAAVCLAGLVLLFALVPRQFGSLMARAFMPISNSALTSRTTISILKPAGGDAVVPANQRVEFLAKIEGRVPQANTPGAPALHYRHTLSDVPVRVALEEDLNGSWGVRLGADQVRTGLYWKITAGDASTPEHQLSVRAQPFVTRFEIEYTYRPYRRIPKETVVFPNEIAPQPRILAHRGTDIVLKARSNTPVKSAVLELDVAGLKKTVPADPVGSDPHLMAFRTSLEKSGFFRIYFETLDHEKNLDRAAYSLEVLEDGAPFVELLKPAQDITAPTNGTVVLAGLAFDDFGVTGLTLKLEVAGTPKPRPLAPQPYRTKVPAKNENVGIPQAVQYLDVLALDQLRTPEGNLANLAPGSEIIYWLEATDNFDFPRPNIGKSKSYKIKLVDPLKDQAQQQKQRQDAQGQKEKHDQKQEQDNKKQDGNKDQPGQNGNDKKDQAGNQPSPEEQQKRDLENKLGKTADPINDALNKDNPKNDPGNKSPENSKGSSENGNNNAGGKDSKSDDKNPDPKKGDNNPMGSSGNSGQDPKNSPDKKDDTGNKKSDAKGSGQESSSGNAPDQKDNKQNNKNKGGTQNASSTAPDKNPNKDAKADDVGKGKGTPGYEKSTGKTDGPATNEEGTTSANAKSEKSTKRPDGKTKPGEAKGDEPMSAPNGEPKSEAKKKEGTGKEGGPQAKSKGEGQKPGDQGQTKEPSAEQKNQDSAWAKNDGPDRTPSLKEIDALKDLLKKGGPEADKAAKDMVDRGKDTDDPKIRKALEDTLKEAGRKDDLKNLTGASPEMLPMPDPAGTAPTAGNPMGTKDDGGPKEIGKAPKEGPGQGNEPAPATASGGRGMFEDLKAITPEEAFKRRMGNLQLQNLEDLKKRITPDLLKKANISNEEWARFLENAQKYQSLVQQTRKRDDFKILQGGAGKIAGQGPRNIESGPGARLDPLANGQATPPWEFRDAQREFTRKGKAP